MKTVFDKTTRDELIKRIQSLDKKSSAQWGKMNVYQMVKHCHSWENWIHGKDGRTYKQEFIGRVFGKMALRRLTRDDRPLDKKVPTSTWLKIKEQECDLDQLKLEWVAFMESYDTYSNPAFIHDFFGKMTPEQIGVLSYKHNDHHLRQFGA